VVLGGIVLSASTTSCAGTAVKTHIEYVYIAPDTPTFPIFPPPDHVAYDEETDLVTMPLWYWREIAEYKIGVDAVSDYLERLKSAKTSIR
jgi:hypothetical protein